MSKPFYTIGIGASAGGQRALIAFLEKLSPNVKAAIVIVTHLMRERKSILTQILSRYSAMPISRVEKNTELQPGHIYVMIENTELEVKGGWLKVKPRNLSFKNSAVDIFFRSLADDFGDKAIGIVLSGGGNDGLTGTLKINQKGGKVLVQDPNTADVDGMPESVIQYDHPLQILSPAQIAAEINQWCNAT